MSCVPATSDNDLLTTFKRTTVSTTAAGAADEYSGGSLAMYAALIKLTIDPGQARPPRRRLRRPFFLV
jgi:hypothetical protein